MKNLSIIFSLLLTLTACAQDLKTSKKFDKNTPYKFTEIIDVDATSVKSQGRTGTCWSFSTSSL